VTDEYNLNDAKEQRGFDVIPAGTIVTLQMKVRPGGAGDDGFLTKAQDGASEGLDCEFVVADGPYARRKLWQRYTLRGTTPGHEEARTISRGTLRAILESARGIRPDDKSEAAEKARAISNWGDFNGLCFIARLGVRPPQNGYAASNTIAEVITPERHAWKQPAQVQDTASATVTASAPAPANAIVRPEWAKDD
jgi:hypothetical protein